MFMTKIKTVLVVLVVGLAFGGMRLGVLSTHRAAVAQAEPPKQPPAKEEKPLHFVEKPDMKPQLERKLPYTVPTDENPLVPSKAFIADIVLPGKVRFRELIDPRYLKKHGLTDRDLAYE